MPGKIRQPALEDEDAVVTRLLGLVSQSSQQVMAQAVAWVEAARALPPKADLQGFMQEFSLSTREGVALMRLAEALIRIPETQTRDALIRDRLAEGDWKSHLGHSPVAAINLSSWALALGRDMVQPDHPPGLLDVVTARLGQPVMRQAIAAAIHHLARQFVLGADLDDALGRAGTKICSFDMLGEGAKTPGDAERYFHAYHQAIARLGATNSGHSISIKLSALYPRYEAMQERNVIHELTPILTDLCRSARQHGVTVTIDAEEADRLELSLSVIQSVALDPALKDWDGLGLAIQAYQKRALAVIDWVGELALARGTGMGVRLVKGAYWDTEIKRAQERGLSGFPVFTRKWATDLSYLACAARLMELKAWLRPAFATHNAHTMAWIMEHAPVGMDWEFQRLHGMGDELYQAMGHLARCRVYAPVGSHRELLPYLVRRLLENGANSSFVHHLADRERSAAEIISDPVISARRDRHKPHSRVRLPADLHLPHWRNSVTLDLSDPAQSRPLVEKITTASLGHWQAQPWLDGQPMAGEGGWMICDPSDRNRVLGTAFAPSNAQLDRAMQSAAKAHGAWEQQGGEVRAEILDRCAEAIESHRDTLCLMLVREAGKTIPDALGEIREAQDFLRYYAYLARTHFAEPTFLSGVVGEHSRLYWRGRGVFVTISPWNFPLAIFVGQIAGALAAGNCVVAKPAEETPLIAVRCAEILYQAGLPPEVLQILPGDGRVGQRLVTHPLTSGVAFTGSVAVARHINQILAALDGPIRPLIAETGGLNAMIVDSSALPEQVVADALISAFGAAGQRCSALRVMFVQDSIMDGLASMLAEALECWHVGDPACLETDMGPLISQQAREGVARHLELTGAAVIKKYKLDQYIERRGWFFAPHILRMEDPSPINQEVFGPVLTLVPFQWGHLDKVLDWLRTRHFGLTLGVQSRIDSVVKRFVAEAPVGNIYVNRQMTGAMVGSHPFGGEGLSGTGPKAGGPHYLFRFAVERTVTENSAAAGGNAALFM